MFSSWLLSIAQVKRDKASGTLFSSDTGMTGKKKRKKQMTRQKKKTKSKRRREVWRDDAIRRD